MGILDLKTNLKSLRYGKDRPFGGSSNQPYVTRDIDVRDSEVGRTGGPDFLLRGGTLIPRRVVNDVSRMTQMLFDLKSPNGILFTAKQNVLGLTSTNFTGGYTPPKLRERKQNLSGIAKVTDAIGTFAENLNTTANVYNPLSTIAQTAGGFLGLHLEKQGVLPPILGPAKYLEFITEGSGKRSRILSLKENKLTTRDNLLYEYQGGPGSVNGIGKTRILKGESTNLNIEDFQNFGLSSYEDLEELSNKSTEKGKGNTEIFDFRQEIAGTKQKSLDYTKGNLENRVHLGDPGKKGKKIKDYRVGLGEALDKINALPLYKGVNQDNSKDINDFVKFRIGVISNSNPNQKTYVHFRAILDELSDSYNAEYSSENYMGRAEEFYRYNGFSRTISLGWTVAAQSKQELIPMYKRLNYLASSLAPDYTNIGYMAGNLVTLTLGGWFYEQPGIITSMTLSPPQESPWELAIPSNGSGGNDTSVKELPHIIKVTGVQFKPIHKFVPRVQRNEYNGSPDGIGDVTKFGKERYLALAIGGGKQHNNYDNPGSEIPVATVEVGEGDFGGAFDQGGFVDIDSLSSEDFEV